MLNYKNENGNVKELAAGGSMGDLLAESAYLLTAVWRSTVCLRAETRQRQRFSR